VNLIATRSINIVMLNHMSQVHVLKLTVNVWRQKDARIRKMSNQPETPPLDKRKIYGTIGALFVIAGVVLKLCGFY
jgi:hypothetical protein